MGLGCLSTAIEIESEKPNGDTKMTEEPRFKALLTATTMGELSRLETPIINECLPTKFSGYKKRDGETDEDMISRAYSKGFSLALRLARGDFRLDDGDFVWPIRGEDGILREGLTEGLEDSS